MIKELVNVHLSNVINNIKQIYMRRIMHGYNGKNNIIKKQLLKAYYGGTNI
jgi:hypothetical protein